MSGAPRAPRGPGVPEALGKGLVVLPTGALSLEQLKAVFATLPVDVTFVDADDRVRFFSEGKDRVFERPKAILGRLVQHCHPPGSVDVVERILSDFRSGRQDVAEFWIDFKGRFAHIRYFALRDEKGTYLGTLEVTVADLLESWPKIEELLIAQAPAFRRLKKAGLPFVRARGIPRPLRDLRLARLKPSDTRRDPLSGGGSSRCAGASRRGRPRRPRGRRAGAGGRTPPSGEA
jgi:hypothetical protein